MIKQTITYLGYKITVHEEVRRHQVTGAQFGLTSLNEVIRIQDNKGRDIDNSMPIISKLEDRIEYAKRLIDEDIEAIERSNAFYK